MDAALIIYANISLNDVHSVFLANDLQVICRWSSSVNFEAILQDPYIWCCRLSVSELYE